jgi:hypothetical protein
MVSKQGADGNPGTEVQAFLQGLKHSRKDAVEAVREIILSAHSGITEQTKRNAPSFGIDGDARITFRLQPGDRVQLVFHRGAQKRTTPPRSPSRTAPACWSGSPATGRWSPPGISTTLRPRAPL